jgi:hypothetical protein
LRHDYTTMFPCLHPTSLLAAAGSGSPDPGLVSARLTP